MAVRTGDSDTEYQTVGVEATELDQYAEVSLEDGEVVIYDQENEDAWVQSAAAVALDAMI